MSRSNDLRQKWLFVDRRFAGRDRFLGEDLGDLRRIGREGNAGKNRTEPVVEVAAQTAALLFSHVDESIATCA